MSPQSIRTQTLLSVSVPTIAIIILTYYWYRKRNENQPKPDDDRQESSATKANRSECLFDVESTENFEEHNLSVMINAIHKVVKDLEMAQPIDERDEELYLDEEERKALDLAKEYAQLSKSIEQITIKDSLIGHSVESIQENVKIIAEQLKLMENEKLSNEKETYARELRSNNNGESKISSYIVNFDPEDSEGIRGIMSSISGRDLLSINGSVENAAGKSSALIAPYENAKISADPIAEAIDRLIISPKDNGTETVELASENAQCESDVKVGTSDCATVVGYEKPELVAATPSKKRNKAKKKREKMQKIKMSEFAGAASQEHPKTKQGTPNTSPRGEPIPVIITDRDRSSNRGNKWKNSSGKSSVNSYAAAVRVARSDSGVTTVEMARLETALDSFKYEERDSANHSPAYSEACTNFSATESCTHLSDAGSDGSSDSGKGHSEGTTTPPPSFAIPSECSLSLADPSSHTVYQFMMPQVYVGRLIGAHGVFITRIKEETKTQIVIKRHPTTNELKLCAIKGFPQDVYAALAMIRKKFPIAFYPEISMEEVPSILPLPMPYTIRPELLRIDLVEGVNNEVTISCIMDGGHLFLQQPTHPSFHSFATLTSTMNCVYSCPDVPPIFNAALENIVACPTESGWCRAQLVSMNEMEDMCEVRLVDLGGYMMTRMSALKAIRVDLLNLPFQAIECMLANIAPTSGIWADGASELLEKWSNGVLLHAQVYDYTETGLPLILLYASIEGQVVSLNDELIANGYAYSITYEEMQAQLAMEEMQAQLAIEGMNVQLAIEGMEPQFQEEGTAIDA